MGCLKTIAAGVGLLGFALLAFIVVGSVVMVIKVGLDDFPEGLLANGSGLLVWGLVLAGVGLGVSHYLDSRYPRA